MALPSTASCILPPHSAGTLKPESRCTPPGPGSSGTSAPVFCPADVSGVSLTPGALSPTRDSQVRLAGRRAEASQDPTALFPQAWRLGPRSGPCRPLTPEGCLSQLFVAVAGRPDWNNAEEEVALQLMVSEAQSVGGRLALGRGEAAHRGGRAWWREAAQDMPARKQRQLCSPGTKCRPKSHPRDPLLQPHPTCTGSLPL